MGRLYAGFLSCYAFHSYGRFTGRACREEFWTFMGMQMLIANVIGFVAALFCYAFADAIGPETLYALMTLELSDAIADAVIFSCGLVILFWIGSIVPALSVTVRRYRDAGCSPFLFLLCIFCWLSFLWPILQVEDLLFLEPDTLVMPGLLAQAASIVHLLVCMSPTAGMEPN